MEACNDESSVYLEYPACILIVSSLAVDLFALWESAIQFLGKREPARHISGRLFSGYISLLQCIRKGTRSRKFLPV